jgi:hypothetical protein
MRKTLGVALLVLAFCCPVAAGEIHNPPPEPPPPGGAQGPSTGDEVNKGATDTLTQTALDILALLPSLL